MQYRFLPAGGSSSLRAVYVGEQQQQRKKQREAVVLLVAKALSSVCIGISAEKAAIYPRSSALRSSSFSDLRSSPAACPRGAAGPPREEMYRGRPPPRGGYPPPFEGRGPPPPRPYPAPGYRDDRSRPRPPYHSGYHDHGPPDPYRRSPPRRRYPSPGSDSNRGGELWTGGPPREVREPRSERAEHTGQPAGYRTHTGLGGLRGRIRLRGKISVSHL